MRTRTAELVSIGIAAIALTFSMVSFAFTYHLTEQVSVTDIKPVLIYEYSGETGWILRNVGKGPALNVLVAQKQPQASWFNPVRVPPLAAGSSFVPTWLGHVNTTGLGATYTDVDGRKYSSTAGNDLTEVHDSYVFGPWKEDEIGRHWNQPAYR